jgi:hypothetical protein
MIIQLLGVALISLLTITPTIQQNKINIEIQPMITQQAVESDYQNQVLILGNWNLLVYSSSAGINFINNFNSTVNGQTTAGVKLLLNPDVTNWASTNLSSQLDNGIFIENNNFYITTTGETVLTGIQMRDFISQYVITKLGGTNLTHTFSFTVSTDNIVETTTFYTYTTNDTVGGSNTSISGRIYYQNVDLTDSNTGSRTNGNITVSQNSTLQTVINSINPTVTLENTTIETSNHKQVLYYFNQPIPLDTVGTYTRTLYSRTNYLRNINHGEITINVTLTDSTPPVITGPTSLTFEVGTYSLIEQLLNQFYTFEDNIGIEDAYYFPVTSINTVGTFNITVYATDAAGNQTNLPVTITTTAPPPNDTTPPVITGSDTITRNLGQVNNDEQLANQFNITDDLTQPSAIVKSISGTRSYTEAGTYNLTLTATDFAGNVATKQFTFIINPPVIDNEPPVIDSDLIVSITIGDFTDRQEILDFYTTVTDNVALSTVLLVGDINFNEIGDYQLQIIATDTSQNQATRNILIRIKDEVILGNYNPLTDLLSGIFGGALSMIFTIGTIEVLGLRLLDAMGVIILGAVLLFVYKAIKGGS